MTRLTRYFLAAYLTPLFAGTGSLLVLVMMADLLERLDKFITGNTGIGLVAQYALALLPVRLTEILPVAVLLAALLSLGNLSHHREIIAAMSGGVHPWRCVRPLLWTGFALSVMCLAVGEYVAPAAATKARRIWNEDVRHIAAQRRTQFTNVTAAGPGTLYAVGRLDTAEGWMEDVLMDTTVAGRPRSQIQAARADWRGDRWIFRKGVERTFGEDGLEIKDQKFFPIRELRTRESPADLVPPEEKNTDTLGYKNLKRHIRRLKALGIPTRRLEVEMHMKLALPWANFIILLLGIPFAFLKEGGRVKAIGFALGVAFFYFGLMQVGRAVGQKPWCAPWFGAWMTNLLFLAVGTWSFSRMRKV